MPAFSACAIAGATNVGSKSHPALIAAYPPWIASSMAVLYWDSRPWLAKIVGFMPAAVAIAASACAISVHAASALSPGRIMTFFPLRFAMLGSLPP